MSAAAPDVLDDRARDRVLELAAVLVPAGHGMPSAAEVEDLDLQVGRVLASRPDLLEPLARALAENGTPAEVVDRMARVAPADLAALRVVVLGAYYMSPRVRELLRYPGQMARPIVEDEAAEVLDLLQPVIQRGPTFRVSPNT